MNAKAALKLGEPPCQGAQDRACTRSCCVAAVCARLDAAEDRIRAAGFSPEVHLWSDVLEELVEAEELATLDLLAAVAERTAAGCEAEHEAADALIQGYRTRLLEVGDRLQAAGHPAPWSAVLWHLVRNWEVAGDMAGVGAALETAERLLSELRASHDELPHG